MPSSSSPPTQTPTFSSLLTTLLSSRPPLIAPPKPYNPSLNQPITSLSLHPTLETILHILNGDPASAHFLVRHMQAAPQYEGMLLHGILHRCEGDYDNARAWYRNVGQGAGADVYGEVWGLPNDGDGDEDADGEGDGGKKDGGQALIDKVEAWKKRREGDEEEIKNECRGEMERLAEWCSKKFGEGGYEDVSGVWCQPGGEHKEIKDKMIIGGEGWRQF